MADLRASGLGGVPKGQTADRPSSPSIGDVFYNGDLGYMEMYTAQGWFAATPINPGIPTSVVATNTGSGRAFNNGRASVAFSVGTDGGLPTSFTVTSSPGSYTATGSSSPILVTGLQSNTSYTYTVTATNNFGTSLASAASNSITATTIPQPPTISGIPGYQSAILTLTGNNGGSAITQYTITSTPATTTQIATSSSYTFTGLTIGTAYTFTATATNANGTSAVGSASNSITPTNITVSGGTQYSDSTYYYRKFTGNGTLAVNNGTLNMDVLVVGGGGSSGNGTNVCAGGGAGGLVYETSKSISAGSYSVTIGAGGAAGSSFDRGLDTTIFNITAVGGGRGGNESVAAQNGGSGGGAVWSNATTQTPGSSTQNSTYSGFGNRGGYAAASGVYGSGGGGGAGAVGGDGGSNGGAGGIGKYYDDFGSVTSSGHFINSHYYFAGGGGGGAWVAGNADAQGGYGGGGKGSFNGGSSTAATGGTANTGGGGGGPGVGATNSATNGGSGIVIVRYLKSDASS